ncbi:non-homologous end-joining DNA ligase [Streptomyces sp. NBC_01497]|uniref:non-homologous end-joining DNA ligase n=1 Tax=Streptomyces sp. NBC_01497 TaxID=2903885 RepID=UPI002E35B4AF|nr:non-homologous end-joining DNA ligase [Streptomyces sp. NBC_01497]
MLAVAAPAPDDRGSAAWAFEVKWDGVRCVVGTRGDGTVRLGARTGTDITARYPELAALGARLRGRDAVLDGEVVVLDEGGRPDFGLLQRRMGVTGPGRAAALARTLPVRLVLFDITRLDGASLLRVPYEERRGLLAGLGLDDGPHWSVPAHLRGRGHEAWRTTLDHGYEGIVAKRLSSPYTPGVRSPHWRKTRHLVTLDVVLGGWNEGRGGLGGLPGSVLVGVAEGAGLRYAGAVGSGLSGDERRELARYFRVLARDTSPFAGPVDVAAPHFAEPRLVAEVAFSGWTSSGLLRQPVWHRLRPDLTRLD